MPQFLLLLYHDPAGWQDMSAEARQAETAKYMAWAQRPFARGAQRLIDESGKVMRSSGGRPQVMDGPYSETKEILGGFFVIEAADYAEAVERTRDHPHLGHGTIEIRQVFGT